MTLFTDYQCPSCRVLYEDSLRPMIGGYIASGKVYLLHYDFPLPQHAYAYQAARWADAAASVGEFPNAEAALYDNQAAWEASGDIEKYIASRIPSAEFLRMKKLMEGCAFQDRKGSCRFDASIEADQALGAKIPIHYTPTYIISYKGHNVLSNYGATPWPALKQLFDSLLKQ